MDKVNVQEKLNTFNGHWNPKIVGEVNESYIKVVKLKGEFLWHTHEHEDEMFYVLKGRLTIKFRNRDTHLDEGEFLIIPKGVEHMPAAEEEAHVMLVEAKTTLNTGDIVNERTVRDLEKI